MNTSQPCPTTDLDFPERKRAERDLFERIYSDRVEDDKRAFRNYLLSDSEQFFRERLRQLCPGKRVLELGCGRGFHCLLAASAGARSVLGVDFSPAALTEALSAAERAGLGDITKFENADVEHLPYPANSFDLIVNHETFSSVDLRLVLPEINRVLAADGHVLGVECLAHNPIFALNRAINTARGLRSTWAFRHILRQDDLRNIADSAAEFSATYFHLCSPAAAPFWRLSHVRRILAAAAGLRRLDLWLLRRRFLQRYAFKVVFEWRNRKSAAHLCAETSSRVGT